MTKDEVLKLALATLDEVRQETFRLLRNGNRLYAENKVWDTITAIKEVLAHPEEHTSCSGQEPAVQVEPVEVKQIAEALRQVGLTLVRTGGSFRVMDLGRIEAQTTYQPAVPERKPWVGLTEQEAADCWSTSAVQTWKEIESALKAKNT